MAEEPPWPLEEILLPPELVLELVFPTRLVAALMAEEPLRGAPLYPPPLVLPVLATVPVALSDEVVELRDTEEVEDTVMVEFARISPALAVRPRPLRLPLSRGAIRLAYFSAAVVPVSLMVRSSRLVSTVAVGSCAVADPPASGTAPLGRSFKYRPPATRTISGTPSHGQRLRLVVSGA